MTRIKGILTATLAMLGIMGTSVPTAQAEYVTVTGRSKKYHETMECRGLMATTPQKVKKVTKDEALAAGRTPCAVCYKQAKVKPVLVQE